MEKQKYTPGPWAFNTFTEHPSKRGGFFIYAPRIKPEIAKLFTQGEYKAYSVHNGEAQANARLIAAAPELLAACQMMLRLIEGEEWEERFDGETTILRDTIAKAEGTE